MYCPTPAVTVNVLVLELLSVVVKPLTVLRFASDETPV